MSLMVSNCVICFGRDLFVFLNKFYKSATKQLLSIICDLLVLVSLSLEPVVDEGSGKIEITGDRFFLISRRVRLCFEDLSENVSLFFAASKDNLRTGCHCLF